MNDRLCPILIKSGLSFERVFRQTEERGLSGSRNLMKRNLRNNDRLRRLQLHFQESVRDLFQVCIRVKLRSRNVQFQGLNNRGLDSGHIPSARERELKLPPQVSFCQFQSDQRANVTTRFGWC
jgi:hypothetical protein